MEWLTIVAILAGPIIALRLQAVLDSRKADRERRLRVFKTLMVTRGSALSPAHVEALNSIDIEFNGATEEDAKVREAWKAYLDHLTQRLGENATEDDQRRWSERTQEFLVELLYVMSPVVGYNFDRTYIKRTAYTPIRYADVEFEHDFIRRSAIQLFLGKKTFPVELRYPPRETDGESSEERLRRLLIEHYEGGKPLRVILVDQRSVEPDTSGSTG